MANLGANNSFESLAPRPPAETGGLPWRLFMFVLFLLIVAVAAYLGLMLGYRPVLESRIRTIDSEIEALTVEIPDAERENFVRLYSQVTNLQGVLKNHVRAAGIFSVLERNTHVGVYYTSFDLSVAERRASVEGVALSYEVLAQQLQAWAKVPQVTKSTITESQLAEGRVRFRLLLTFDKSVFNPSATVAQNGGSKTP